MREGQEQESCPLRGLNLCDGHRVEATDRDPEFCYCASAELCDEVGWSGAARSQRELRDLTAHSAQQMRYRRIFRFS